MTAPALRIFVHTPPFDLDDPANELYLFQLRVELPHSESNGLTSDAWTTPTGAVFGNARGPVLN